MDKNTEQKLRRIWCERLIIGLFASTALGFFVAKIPTVYSQMQVLEQAQEPAQMHLANKQALRKVDVYLVNKQALAQVEVYQPKTKALTIDKQVLSVVMQVYLENKQAEAQQFILLGISALCFMLMLLLLLRRNQISLTLTGQLIIVLPEECIVELEAFHQQIKFDGTSKE